MTRKNKNRTANSTLAIGGVSSPLDSFVVAESSVLRTNFCAEKPAHRQSAKRCGYRKLEIAFQFTLHSEGSELRCRTFASCAQCLFTDFSGMGLDWIVYLIGPARCRIEAGLGIKGLVFFNVNAWGVFSFHF